MNISFIKSSEKKKLMQDLNNMFGIQELPYLLIQTGKEKIRGFSGNLSKEEIMQLGKMLNVEIIGIYLIKREREDDLRLSFDASIILKDQITKNIVNVDDNQLKEWLKGNGLDIKANPGSVLIKNGDDIVGCGKSNGESIFNYVPKDRRLRK